MNRVSWMSPKTPSPFASRSARKASGARVRVARSRGWSPSEVKTTQVPVVADVGVVRRAVRLGGALHPEGPAQQGVAHVDARAARGAAGRDEVRRGARERDVAPVRARRRARRSARSPARRPRAPSGTLTSVGGARERVVRALRRDRHEDVRDAVGVAGDEIGRGRGEERPAGRRGSGTARSTRRRRSARPGTSRRRPAAGRPRQAAGAAAGATAASPATRRAPTAATAPRRIGGWRVRGGCSSGRLRFGDEG